MEESRRHKVIYNIGGFEIPLMVLEEEEPLFVQAREMLQDRLAVLKNKYASRANVNQLLIAIAVETLVDALKVKKHYNKLRTEIEDQIDSLNISLQD